MARKTSGGRCDILSSELSMNNSHAQDAHQVFDEMLKSEFDDWRPPNRALEVTIRKVCYPITESVLFQVFGSFGVVEQVHVLGGSGSYHVLARVVFHSKNEAADAFGELHGRYLYAGCCQLDIKWGLEEKSHPKTMASSSSNLFQAFVTTSGAEEHAPDTGLAVTSEMDTDVVTGIIDIELLVICSALGLEVDTGVNHETSVSLLVETASEELNFEKLHMEVATIEAQADATAIGARAMHGEVALAVQPVAAELLAHTTSIIMNDVAPVLNLATSASSASDIMPSNRNISMCAPENISTADQVSPSTNLVLYIDVLPGKVMLQDIVSFIIPASRCVVDCGLKICDGSMLILWPLPTKCEFTTVRPMPWPSFTLVDGWTIVWFCALFKKPPWPPPVENNLRCVLVMLVQLVLVEIMSDRGQEKWGICDSKPLVFMLLSWKTHALMSFDLAVQFITEWCFSLLRQPPWPLLDLCVLLIPQDMGNYQNLPMGLPEAKSGIKAHSWPLLAHIIEIIQRARFWLARTIHVVQFSILSAGGLCLSAYLQRFELGNIREDPKVCVKVHSRIIFSFYAQLQCSVRSKLMFASINATPRAEVTTSAHSVLPGNWLLLSVHLGMSAQVLEQHISISSNTSQTCASWMWFRPIQTYQYYVVLKCELWRCKLDVHLLGYDGSVNSNSSIRGTEHFGAASSVQNATSTWFHGTYAHKGEGERNVVYIGGVIFKLQGLLQLAAAPMVTKVMFLRSTYLQTPWDPGGGDLHRLEGKLNFKKGGMLVTYVGRQQYGPWASASRSPSEETTKREQHNEWKHKRNIQNKVYHLFVPLLSTAPLPSSWYWISFT